MRNSLELAGLIGLGVTVGIGARSEFFATDPQGIWNDGGSALTAGTPFTVSGGGVTIRELGFFDEGSDGLLESHTVGIYDTTGSHDLLGSVVIPSGITASLQNGTRWAALSTPVTLTGDRTYLLAATFSAAGDRGNVASAAQVSLGVGFGLDGPGFTYAPGASLSYPSLVAGAGVYVFGGNMSTVPEVSEYGVAIGMGLVFFGFWRRYRSSTARG